MTEANDQNAVLLKLVNRYKEQLSDTDIKLANALVMVDKLQEQIDQQNNKIAQLTTDSESNSPVIDAVAEEPERSKRKK